MNCVVKQLQPLINCSTKVILYAYDKIRYLTLAVPYIKFIHQIIIILA